VVRRNGPASPVLTRILVVDDDPSTRFVIRLILEKAGYEIIEAMHGEDALEKIKPDPLPDMVSTDLMMPFLNGSELIHRLRSEPRTAKIPIVVVSSSPQAARELMAAGLVDAIIAKPFAAGKLVDGIGAVASHHKGPQLMESSG
jgi:CheY-like chemotaxis protein